MVEDVDYMQLFYEIRMEFKEMSTDSEVFKEIVTMMDDMEARLKGGPDYE